MKKRCLILLWLIGGIVLPLLAAPITVEQAYKVAEDFFSTSLVTRGISSVKLIYTPAATRSSGGDAEYYIFAPESKVGFVVVAGDDELSPIVGYSYTSVVADKLPDAMSAWLGEYSRYVDDVRSGQVKVSATYTRGGQSVEPLLKINWDQGMPYNDLCPGNSPAGCVAISMAQIMKYHEWPVQGEGTLVHNAGTVDLTTYQYDWDNMLDTYFTTWNEQGQQVPDGYTDEQAKAVATLIRDCGYSVKMNYGTSESGAATELMVKALYEHFKYAPTMRFLSRELYTTANWTTFIREELLAGRPINYSGATRAGAGHSVVCDGIDANDFLHINWGWNGSYDGYFDMNILAPEGIGIGGGDTGGYFRGQGIIVGIRPCSTDDEGIVPEKKLCAFDLNLSLTGENKDILHLAFSALKNNSIYTQEVLPGILWKGRDGGKDVLNRIDFGGSFSALEPGYFYKEVTGWVGDIPSEPGTYPFLIVNIRSGEEGGYDLMDTGDFADGGTLTVSADGTKTLEINQAERMANLELVSAESSGTIYAGWAGKIKIVLENKGEALGTEELFPALIPEAVDESQLSTYKDYINLSSYPGIGYNYTLKPYIYGRDKQELIYSAWKIEKTGKYKVRICRQVQDKDNNMVYLPIPGADNQVVEVVSLPDYPVFIFSEPLTLRPTEFQQDAVAYIQLTFPRGNITGTYDGRFELWARKVDDPGTQEIRLYVTPYEYGFNAGFIDSKDMSSQTESFLSMEPGVYEAYLKYNVQGEWKRIEDPYNSVKFTLNASESPLLFFSAPAVINGGQPVPANSLVEVKMTLSALKAFKGTVSVATYNPNYERFVMQSRGGVQVELQPGMSKVVKLQCHTEEAPEGHYELGVLVTPEVEGEYWNFSFGTYTESAGFDFTHAVPACVVQDSKTLINGEDNMFVEQGTKGEFQASFVSQEDLNGELYLYCVDWSGLRFLETTPVEVSLKAGASQTLSLPFVCPRTTPTNYYNYQYYVRPQGYNAFCLVDSDKFNNAVSITEYTGIEGETAASYRLISLSDAFLLKGLEGRVHVRVSSLNGSVLFEGESDGSEMRIPMSGVAQGLYLISVESANGKQVTLKGMLK